MNGMSESFTVQHINAQCHPVLVYLHRLSGVHYLATFESACNYQLQPIHGASRHISVRELANAEVWQQLN